MDYIAKVRPKKAFLVHGDDDAVEWFRAEIHKNLPKTEAIVPLPGEEHRI
jgi:predicted metal-dependent RNase